MMRQFERKGSFDKHIVFGHFTRDEIVYLKNNGYEETWRENVERNKNGIRVER